MLFLGRFTAGKGVLQAIDIATRAGLRILLAAPEDDYYREHVHPLVDGTRVVYAGEVGHDDKVRLAGGRVASSTPFSRGNRSASCSPRRWRAAPRWRRSTAAPSAKSWTKA